jgi:lysophospholipase L1-like esterase
MHSTSVDGIHPSDYGYTLWAKSVKKPLLKILAKYGIR